MCERRRQIKLADDERVIIYRGLMCDGERHRRSTDIANRTTVTAERGVDVWEFRDDAVNQDL